MRKNPTLSVVLYAIAALVLAYSLWAAVYSIRYIAEMIAQGQLVLKGSWYDVISFIMGNFGQYFFWAVALYSLGRIFQKEAGCAAPTVLNDAPANNPTPTVEQPAVSEDPIPVDGEPIPEQH
jgi:hypothetical protein